MSTGVDVDADRLAAAGEVCGVCLRDELAIGRMRGVRLVSGEHYSAPVCGDCLLVLLTGDWRGLRRFVVEWQLSDESPARRFRHWLAARRIARRITAADRRLFANLSDPNDAPREGGTR